MIFRRVGCGWYCSESSIRSDRHFGLLLWRCARPFSSRRPTAGRARSGFAPNGGKQWRRSSAGRCPRSKDALDRFLSLQGGHALTPVDCFNTSAGQSDPYLNLCIRQPIPASFSQGTWKFSWISEIFLPGVMCPSWVEMGTLFIWCNRRARCAAASPSASSVPLLQSGTSGSSRFPACTDLLPGEDARRSTFVSLAALRRISLADHCHHHRS